MTMNIIKRSILYILGIFLCIACSKTLEEIPHDRLSEENFYNTQQDAEAAVYSIYQPLRTGNYYGFVFPILLEAHSDYANGRGSYGPVSQYTNLDGTNIGRTEGVWAACYQAILRANIVLDKVPDIEMDEAMKNALFAEARFLRALAYFDLVRNWGGVPIRRLSEEPNDLARSTEDEVYQFIIEDLRLAEQGLPTQEPVPGRPTANSAKTLLAFVYLTMENWEGARDKAKEVMDAGQYSLVPVSEAEDFENLFGASVISSSEEIFSLKYSATGGQGFQYLSYIHAENSHYSPVGFRTIYAHGSYPLIGNWSDDDLRKEYNIYNQYINRNSGQLVTLPSLEPYQFKKFKDLASIAGNANGNDFPLLRYPDVLLIYAEAANQAEGSPSSEAYEAVNQVRRRAYGSNPGLANPEVDLAGLSQTDFREAVMNERAYEFMVEGKRWYDLKRMGRERVRQLIQEAKGRSVTDSYFLWPIPQVELDNNDLINAEDQNPGY